MRSPRRAGRRPADVETTPEVMRAIVEADRLEAVAAPPMRATPLLLDRGSPEKHAAMGDRYLAASRGWYAWETTVQPYLELVERLGSAPVRV